MNAVVRITCGVDGRLGAAVWCCYTLFLQWYFAVAWFPPCLPPSTSVLSIWRQTLACSGSECFSDTRASKVTLVKNPAANPRAKGDTDSIPGSGRSSAGGNGNPLQHSCLGNPMDRGAWWATVHGSQRVRHNWEAEHTCTVYDGKYDQWRMALASLLRSLLLSHVGFPLFFSSL